MLKKPAIRISAYPYIQARLITMQRFASEDRKAELKEQYESIQQDVIKASAGRTPASLLQDSCHDGKGADYSVDKQPRLVLVSKLKPPSDILAMYEATGHVCFGENYIQELVDKAKQVVTSEMLELATFTTAVPNLSALETLDSVKKADLLEAALAVQGRKLNVFIQVNTSSEASKAGLPPLTQAITAPTATSNESATTVDALALHVLRKCPHLVLQGLMTIGSWDASHDANKPNPDFAALKETRKWLAAYLGKEEHDLELSMGMSADFEAAIREGSTNDAVSLADYKSIGSRPSKEEAKKLRDAEIKSQ